MRKVFRPLPSYPALDMAHISSGADYLLSQSVLAQLEEERKRLCKLQFDLADLVFKKRDGDYFDSKWLSMSPKTRESHILDGLVVSCGRGRAEDHRMWCPETTMAVMQKDGGQGFLNLLTTICPKNVTKVDLRPEPIFISHPVFDGWYHIGKPCPPGQNEAVYKVLQGSTLR